eukprot:8430184-Pyramimonas_sp.AAC.1
MSSADPASPLTASRAGLCAKFWGSLKQTLTPWLPRRRSTLLPACAVSWATCSRVGSSPPLSAIAWQIVPRRRRSSFCELGAA